MQQDSALTSLGGRQAVTAEPHGAEHAEAHHESPEQAKANSKLAMWLFLASEVIFFSVLIGAYIFARFQHPDEHSLLNIQLTGLNTFLLLTSSFTVVRAIAAVQAGQIVKMQRSLMLTLILGVIFYALMINEYNMLSHEGVTLSSGPFGFAFFTLTGFHGFHVLIGLVWTVIVFYKSLNGAYSKEEYWGLEFFGLYWHFVDVVWIFIFTIVYLI